MKIRPLSIEGAYEVTPVVHGDARGSFTEWLRFDKLAEVLGRPVTMTQGNISVSAAGVVRGIHYADVPPGQAKYVTCARGSVLDVVVDLRMGSPTFGAWEGVVLDDRTRRAVYLSEGLGHGFCALTDDATMTYLVSTAYNPSAEHGVHPMDPDLAIDWPASSPVLSGKDTNAPSFAEARAAGLLPSWDRTAPS
ncbi:dTDP-4-dehydrorhamnose 3,5-epimerase [Catenuloplanes nepalensis]|uniref:dTDP-4-dehydrorhamnose 3,5-epimerase n=1 Tax=Catenuloplanes nepalensis TaxID=587533 RepID=A0ABT9N1A8_9ACTN|nr:dTDP-4-dehydrorhamnose 3,5-epimerase family protein [Catenuloplanes nepalensis]MDP9797477.1 dTDP-4-dehydrorhamnose 3,5-epimerase [Catenuloplanes nepalensis]